MQAKDKFGVDITPYAGTIIFSDDIGLKEPLLYGGRVGLFPWAKFGIEGNYSRADASVDTDSSGVPDVTFQNYGADLVWRISPYGTVVPFLLAGVGEAKYESDAAGAPVVSETAYDVGGGLLFKLNRNLGIRLDARDVMHNFADAGGESKLQHNFVGTGGLSLMFGGPFPDDDQDGVENGQDRCPDTPLGARVDKDGCPIEISEIETIMLDTGLIRLADINFETGKSDIKADSHAKLDEVGKILAQWPQLQIELGGHTDSRGSVELNQRLSQERAQSVLSYLTGKFPQIQESQYSVVGYGESTPLEPNNSAANMAKNRRVEFKVLNT
ncbi:MAG: OmpA family protein, partial [Candidatus Rokuibacteriota bacterium]